MSEAAAAAEHERGLEEIADELYALRPDAFAAARDDEVRKARAAGRQPLARELAQLRRPTQSAWLINLLWRNQRDVIEQLLQLGQDMSEAQAQASGPELHRLTALRRALEAALVRGARSLAETAGVNVSASMEREAQETLAASLARPDVADEIRTGRLLKPASYAGFGTVLATMPAPAARRSTADDTVLKPTEAPRKPTPIDRDARAAERVRQQREEADRRVQEARAALETAAEARAEQRRAADAAAEQREAVRAQVEQLQEQIRAAQVEVAAAERAAVAMSRRKDQAEQAHAAALRTLADAEQRRKALATNDG